MYIISIMAETNQLLKTIQETKRDGLNTLMESLDDLTFSQYLNHILEIVSTHLMTPFNK